MSSPEPSIRFEAVLQRPADASEGGSWGFVVLPTEASEKLPRRGRTTVRGAINGFPFEATLDPDGLLSHWLKVDEELRRAADASLGGIVRIGIEPVNPEPDPEIPPDFRCALAAAPKARKVWEETTTLARLDWIHWLTSAKQRKTREKRISDACGMLAAGKKRVCCFDPSGYYSKAFRAPEAAE